MAQELIDKIRAAAQAKGIDPEVALRIARAESGLKVNATPGSSSAGGLFQVVDKTWKEFGGAPGKKFDPDENIRVGTDIIAKNAQTLKTFLQRDPRPAEVYAAHYFGPSGAKTFLSAEPGTPMESLFSKEVIKANPNLKGKTSDQVMASLEKKMGQAPAAAPAPTVSRETAPTPREALPPSLPPMAAAPEPAPDKLASLGPSYQAALALSFLADTEDKEDRDIDREPGVAEKWLAESGTRPTALAGFSDIKIRSPFAEPQPQPQMLAEGGEVEKEEESYPDAGRPTVQEVHVAKAMFPDLPVAEAVYLLRGGSRQSTPQGEMLSGNLGVRIPLGKDADAMLMLAGSRPERGESSSKAMLAMLNQRLGEGNVGATLVRPMDAPSGLYAGNMSASYPLGEGRISGNLNAMRTPDGRTMITDYGVGYGGRVGPGDLSVGISRRANNGPYSGQVEYRLPIGRADGSPEEGEESMASKLLKEVVPMDLRMLGSTLMGNKSPITESNFNKEELAAMQQAVDKAAARTGRTEKGSVQYVDYPKGDEIGPGYQPVGSTLGRFVYEKGPNGQIVITDKYDFYNEGRKDSVEKYEKMGRGEKALSVSGNMLKALATGNFRQIPNEVANAYIGRDGRDVRIKLPVKRADGSPEEGERLTPQQIERIAMEQALEREEASRPATVNPNIQRQGEAARRLAAMRNVNTLPDPKTYAAVSGFLGTAPDEMGFSALHPDREGIRKAGEAGFYTGTALQVAPLVSGAMKLANFGPSSGGTATAASQLGAMKLPGRTGEPIFSPIPSAEAPFVGRLDEMVANLQGPVQKDQFLGMLKGKMRDYDIARAEATLADLLGNAKLNPVDLLNRIKTQYDPSQFKTTVVPPGQKISNYQSSDNPYQGVTGDGPPLGVIHLSQNNPAREQLQEVMDKVDTALFKLGSQSYGRRWAPEMADHLLQAANSPALRLSESTSEGLRTLGTQYRQLASQQKALNEARSDMIYAPSNPEFNKRIFAYAEELEGQGLSFTESYRQARVRATRESFERGNDFLRANNAPTIKVPDFDKFENPSMWSSPGSNRLTPGADELYEQAREVFAVAERPLVEARLALADPADKLSKAYLKEISHNAPYGGQHTALKNSPHDPISFSRFSEHTTDIPGIGKADGIYVNELQSDLLDDLRKKGLKGGSLEKDEQRLRELEGRMRGTTDPTERQAMESKMRNLRTRLYEGMGPNNTPKSGFYELSESFPGMAGSPQVAQQLMVKNAVSGAMQMGKQFVAFPGAESAQAQLYEKLGPNLKSVVKDLGPGFEIRDVTLRDPDGKQLMHKAIVWGPDAAARIQKKGVPFKDGGAVERQTADHRKYL